MGIFDRDRNGYDIIPFCGSWYIRKWVCGSASYMSERFICDGKPSWVFDLDMATPYTLTTASEILDTLKGEQK